MLLSCSQLTKSFGDKLILDQVSFSINEGDRIGLIGVNGAGKSTLLNLLTGKYEPDSGEIARGSGAVGYLEQNSGLETGRSILDEMLSVFSSLLETEERLRALEQEIASLPPDSPLYEERSAEYARLTAEFEAGDGYLIRVKIETVLNGMGFPKELYGRGIGSLSGGEKTRLAMAKLLLEQPALLILDEPTNHLDFKTVMWLEGYLAGYKGALLVVSHDRYFLDRLVTQIWELEERRLFDYPGNYTKYKQLKAERREAWQKAYDKQQAQIASMQEYAEKNIVRASTSNRAKSRLHQLANMERIEKPFGEQKTPSFRFSVSTSPVKELLTVKELELAVGEGEGRKVLADHLSLEIRRNEKAAVIGANGIGKTTLLKSLLGLLPQKGDIRWGRGATKSYYDQESGQMNPENTALEELWSRFPSLPEHQVRGLLGRVLITGDNCYKKVSVLSGGERARLGFAILMAEGRNTLLLDEPTNHLDLASREELEQALAEYEGTLIFVSHDRYFLNAIPTKILELDETGVSVYPGNFEDYLAAKEKEKAGQPPEPPAPASPPGEKGEGYYRSKQQRSEDAKRRKRLAELEQLTEELDGTILRLEIEISDPENGADYQLLQDLCADLEEARAAHDAALEEWLELSGG
ncbi:MAG: ABC-F family ATP-binding cassette domain-containing protein [Oscillospiraceae bacterium]|nr:ABC-F family ATP-binding cassette domain-containing protein [Oscillospiraceae bacterium]